MGKRLCSTQPASGFNVQSSAAVGVPVIEYQHLDSEAGGGIKYLLTAREEKKEEGSWVIPQGEGG